MDNVDVLLAIQLLVLLLVSWAASWCWLLYAKYPTTEYRGMAAMFTGRLARSSSSNGSNLRVSLLERKAS